MPKFRISSVLYFFCKKFKKFFECPYKLLLMVWHPIAHCCVSWSLLFFMVRCVCVLTEVLSIIMFFPNVVCSDHVHCLWSFCSKSSCFAVTTYFMNAYTGILLFSSNKISVLVIGDVWGIEGDSDTPWNNCVNDEPTRTARTIGLPW